MHDTTRRRDRPAAGWIERLESRAHRSASALDAGDWTHGYSGRLAAGAGVGTYTFSTSADVRLSVGAVGGSVLLRDAAGDVAYAARRAVAGVVPAGSYTLVMTSEGAGRHMLLARATPTRAAATLFPAAGTTVAGGWTFASAAPAVDLAVGTIDLPPSGTVRVAGTAAGLASYRLAVSADDLDGAQVTVAVRSADGADLSAEVGPSYPIERATTAAGGRHVADANLAGVFGVTVEVTSATDPVPFRLVVRSVPRPPPRGAVGGGFSLSSGPPAAYPLTTDLGTDLDAATDGCPFTSGDTAAGHDRWTFHADGTGVRTLSASSTPTLVPFTWSARGDQIAVTFGGVTEVATADNDVDSEIYLQVTAADGEDVGTLRVSEPALALG